MSKHSGVFTISLRQDAVMQACATAGEAMGWNEKMASGGSGEWTARLNLLSTGSPVRVRVRLQEDGGSTAVELSISNLGFGPFQNRHVKDRFGKFKAGVEKAAGTKLVDTGQKEFMTRPPAASEVEQATRQVMDNVRSESDAGVLPTPNVPPKVVQQIESREEKVMKEWEHVWLSLQWKSGFVGIGKGWNQENVAQIDQLGRDGFELVSVVQQKDPKWFILFFKRPISE